MQINTKHTIVGSAAIVGLFTLLSRLVGMYRDRVFAMTFGAGNTLDSYYAAFRIPDLVFNLLVLGTLSVAFIPVFTEYFVKDSKEANRIASSILNMALIGMAIVCGILYLFVPQVTKIIAPGFTGQKLADTVTLTKIFLLSPVIFTVSSVFSSILNSLKRFFITSLAPIVYNLGIIAGAVFLYPRFGIRGLGYGVILGAIGHLLVQMIATLGAGFKLQPVLDWKNKGVQKIVKLFIPRIFGVDASQISFLIASIIGSTLASGSIAIFNFANNLQAVPLGIFAYSFAIAAFPSLSEAYAKEDEVKFNSTLAKSMVNVLFFVLPISILLIVLRAQIVRVVLGAGHFDWHATKETANALGIFAISIFAQALVPLFSRSFYARHNTWIPVLNGFISMSINAGASFYFGRKYGVYGLAIGFALANIYDCFVLFTLLRRRLKNFDDNYLGAQALKIIFATVALGLATYFSLRLVNVYVPLDTGVHVFTQGFISGIIGIAVFFALAKIMKMEQADYLTNVVKNRFLR